MCQRSEFRFIMRPLRIEKIMILICIKFFIINFFETFEQMLLSKLLYFLKVYCEGTNTKILAFDLLLIFHMHAHCTISNIVAEYVGGGGGGLERECGWNWKGGKRIRRLQSQQLFYSISRPLSLSLSLKSMHSKGTCPSLR